MDKPADEDPEKLKSAISRLEQQHMLQEQQLSALHEQQKLQMKSAAEQLEQQHKAQLEQLKLQQQQQLMPLKEKQKLAEDRQKDQKKGGPKTIAGYPVSELLKAPFRPPVAK